MTAKMKNPTILRTKLSGALLGLLFDSPFSSWLEKIFVWLGHMMGHGMLARGAIGKQIIRKNQDRSLICSLPRGTKLVVPADVEGVYIYLTGHLLDEDNTTKLLMKALREGDVFLDVGANIGYYSFLAAGIVGTTGKVYAFEPQERLVRYIWESIHVNSVGQFVHVYAAAVSDVDHGESHFYFPSIGQDSTLPSLVHQPWLERYIIVPTVSIDGWRKEKQVGKINIIKIDIEGAEMIALRGMEKTLEQQPPDLIILEIFPEIIAFRDGQVYEPGADSARPSEIISFLNRFEFCPRRILPDGKIGETYGLEDLRSLSKNTNVAFTHKLLNETRPEIFDENRMQQWSN